MTRTASSPERTTTRSAGRLLLLIGVPVLVVLLLAATAIAVVLRSTLLGAVDQRAAAAGGTAVSVSAENARFDIGPSTDGRVHAHVTGRAFGRPSLSVATIGGRTAVRVRCSEPRWVPACQLSVTVAMPAASDLTLQGMNGEVGVHGIVGSVGVTTTNGALDVRGPRGDVVLRTTNGEIRLTDALSVTVQAETVNGAVDLGLLAAPDSVGARTTNGSVTVRVPGATTYAVTAHTTIGNVDTSQMRTDPASGHRIAADTVNGAVQVIPSD